MNLVMICQTAQCWSSDGLSERFEVGEREFDFVFVCYHRAVCMFLNHTRCVSEKSRFGAVTFDKRVVLSVHVQKSE
jgi:hypothetical protein